MCPASESSASEPVSRAATASTTMKAASSPAAHHSRARCCSPACSAWRSVVVPGSHASTFRRGGDASANICSHRYVCKLELGLPFARGMHRRRSDRFRLEGNDSVSRRTLAIVAADRARGHRSARRPAQAARRAPRLPATIRPARRLPARGHRDRQRSRSPTSAPASTATSTGPACSPAAAQVISQGPGTPSLGLKLDGRGRLFVAGGSGGDARVSTPHRPGPGRTRCRPCPSFINDVMLTGGAAWFTDSTNPVLFKLPLGRHGELPAEAVRVPLTGDIVYRPASTPTASPPRRTAAACSSCSPTPASCSASTRTPA